MASVTMTSHIKQTAEGLSNHTCSATVTVTEKSNSASTSGNYSYVTVSYSAKITSNITYTGATRSKAGYLQIVVDGTTKTFTMPMTNGVKQNSIICSGSYDQKVNHKDDGTYTVAFSAQILEGEDPVQSSGVGGYNIVWVASSKQTGSVNTTTIARYSTITSFPAFIIEDGISFKYKDYLSSGTVSFSCKIGSTEIFAGDRQLSVGEHEEYIALSESQLNTVYNTIGATEKSVNFKITLITEGITTTSSKTAKGELRASGNSPLVIDIVPTETALNTYGVDDYVVMRYISKKILRASATALHGSTISSVVVQNGNITATMTYDSGSDMYISDELTNLESGVFKVTATDSRGFTGSLTLTCTLREYTRPTVTNVTIQRTSEITTSGAVTASGSFWNEDPIVDDTAPYLVPFNISITVGVQQFNINYDGSPVNPGNLWNVTQSLPEGTLARDQAYVCTVIATDQFGIQSNPYTITLGIARRAAWMGKYTFKAEGFVGEHFIGVFPVGAIYMSVDQTNPSIYFGGTWVQVAQGRTLIGVGEIEANTDTTYGSVTAGEINPTVNQRGGEITHALATGELPSHTHTINQIQSSFEATPYGLNAGSGTGFADRVIVRAASTANNESTRSAGSGNAHNNMMPYLAVYIWQRTA